RSCGRSRRRCSSSIGTFIGCDILEAGVAHGAALLKVAQVPAGAALRGFLQGPARPPVQLLAGLVDGEAEDLRFVGVGGVARIGPGTSAPAFQETFHQSPYRRLRPLCGTEI